MKFSRIALSLFSSLALFSFASAEDKADEEKIHRSMTPEETVAAMELADGFKMQVFAAEPDVRQPCAFCVDDRGRVWVGENYTYTKYGWAPDERDRILIFEDTNQDGKFDKRTVFSEDILYVSGLEVGYGGVWVGSPPNLLFIPDKNGDDVPDGPPEVVLDGWGAQDQHETLNSFTWGPDGWLYGCHGVFTHSQVGRPKDGGKLLKSGDKFPEPVAEEGRTPINAGVWRYHPVKKEFEVFAHGTSNPWGIDFNDHGQMVMTACVIPHLWHVIQGGRYHRQAGEHFEKHTYGDIKNIAKHTHQGFQNRQGGHAHGGAVLYLGEMFPEEYRGKLFMCNLHHRSMYVDQLAKRGSGLVGDHFEEVMLCQDPWYIGFSLQTGQDGSLYLLDWYDEKICHGQTPEGKTTGRIYRLSYGDEKHKPIDVAKLSNDELVKLQLHKNDWLVRHARRNLAERAAAGEDMKQVHEQLKTMVETHQDETRRLRALWALHVTGATDERLLGKLLTDESDYVRGWTIQLLTENRKVTSQSYAIFTEMAERDSSPVVRLYLASALQRLPLDDRWAIAEKLVAHAEDAGDHNLPLLYWYAIEPLVPSNKAKALKLAQQSKIPLLRQYIARRAAAK